MFLGPFGDFYLHPFMDTNPIIDKLFSVGAHFGYSPSRRHPSIKQYLFGTKGGVELFNLEQTAECLDKALAFIKQLAAERKTILFVGGKAEAREALRRTAEKLSMPYVASRWIGGTLTNFTEIRRRLTLLAEHTEKREKGELAHFTKHERLLIDRTITDLETMFGGLRGMQKLPDALVVIDPRHESIAIEEASNALIPIIALLNTDCDAKKIAYPIPANDATLQSIAYILDEIATVYAQNLGTAPTPVVAAV